MSSTGSDGEPAEEAVDGRERRFRLGGFSDYLRFERGLSDRTLDAYVRDVGQMAAFADERGVEGPDGVTYELLRGFVLDLAEKGRASSTIARKVSTLRTYFRFLVEEGRLEEDPTERLERPRQSRHLPDVLSYDEVTDILEAVRMEHDLAVRDVALLEVLYGAGLRVSELRELRRSDLFLDEGLLRVREGSQGARRAGGPACDRRRSPVPSRPVAGARSGGVRRGRVPEPARSAAQPHGCVDHRPATRRVRRDREARDAPYAPTQLRHTPPGGRSGPGRRPGAPRSRRHLHHSDLHARRSELPA